MRRNFMVFGCCLGACCLSQAGAAETVNGNAALIYWQAFDGLPEVSAQEYEMAIGAPTLSAIDQPTREKVEKADHNLLLLHRGGQRSYCDWGIDFEEDGAEAILPHLAPARGLARLALIRAQMSLRAGREAAGIEAVLDVMTLARFAGRDRSLVGLLVDHSIQRMAQNVAAAHMPRLSQTGLTQLESGLARLPAQNSFAQCMATEREFAPWLVRRVQQTKNDAELLELCQVLGVGNPSDEFVAEVGGRDAIIRHASDLLGLYDTLPGMVERPMARDSSPFQDVMSKAMQNPVGAIFFPALDNAWHANQRFQCFQAMFRAGLAVVQQGDGALRLHLDPTDGREFERVDVEGGFELKSAFKVQAGSAESVRLAIGAVSD